MKSTIDNVPAEIEDAARADGATRLGAFFRVVAPLIRREPPRRKRSTGR
ncbi:hypothetical protein EFD56_27900 [Rhizobium phaseoli]|nr:hypothetical protein EFD56_27900 [Rhizobium phaseoli]